MRCRSTALALTLAICCAQSAGAQTRPASTQPLSWGDAQAGARIAISLEGEALAHERLSLQGHLKNDGIAALPSTGAFAWLLIASDRDNAYYTEQRPLPQLLKAAAVVPGSELAFDLDLSAAAVHASRKGMKLVGGYPEPSEEPPRPLLPLLNPGKLRLQMIVYLPSAAGEKVMLKSAPLTVTLQEKATPPGDVPSLEELDKWFRRDPFAAMRAHNAAVKMGVAARQTAAAVALDRTVPSFARDWATATIADIGGDESAALLIRLLKEGGRDALIAYYGPAVKNAELDAAINAKVEGADPVYLAWVARGYARAKRNVSDALIDKTIASNSQQAKLEIAEALAASGTPRHLALLEGLLASSDSAIRVNAARACGKYKLKERSTVKALVKSLDLPGGEAQQAACDALCDITGFGWRLDEKQSKSDREAIMKRWRAWSMQR